MKKFKRMNAKGSPPNFGRGLAALGLFSLANFLPPLLSPHCAWGGSSRKQDLPALLGEIRASKSKNAAYLALSAHRAASTNDFHVLKECAQDSSPIVQEACNAALKNLPIKSPVYEELYLSLIDSTPVGLKIIGLKAAQEWGTAPAGPKARSIIRGNKIHRFGKDDLGGATPQEIELLQAAAKLLTILKDEEAIDDLLARDEIMGIHAYGGPLIARYGARALPKVVAMARKNDVRKGGALQAIHYMTDSAAIPELLNLALDQDEELANAALSALIQFADQPSYRDRLTEVFRKQTSSRNGFIRGHAYVGLLRMDPQKNIAEAMGVIRQDEEVTLYILNELIKKPNPLAVKYLKNFILFDEKNSPGFTEGRHKAARAIFKASGEKITYQGIARDLRFGRDPFAP